MESNNLKDSNGRYKIRRGMKMYLKLILDALLTDFGHIMAFVLLCATPMVFVYFCYYNTFKVKTND